MGDGRGGGGGGVRRKNVILMSKKVPKVFTSVGRLSHLVYFDRKCMIFT